MEDAGLEFLLDAVDRFPLREEFADSLDHPDPVPLAVLPRDDVAPATPADSNAGSGCGQNVGCAVGAEPRADNRRRRQSSPTRSAQSTDRVNPQAPGWTKRLRLVNAPPDRTPCPSRMSAIEQSIHKFAEEPSKSVVRPELGLSFDSLGEAYDFYNLYSWEIGFGIRYGKSRLNAERMKSMQEIVCGCSGKPEAENSRSCRCECPILIRLLRACDNSWYITEHRESHNHSMSLTMGEKVREIKPLPWDLVCNRRVEHCGVGIACSCRDGSRLC